MTLTMMQPALPAGQEQRSQAPAAMASPYQYEYPPMSFSSQTPLPPPQSQSVAATSTMRPSHVSFGGGALSNQLMSSTSTYGSHPSTSVSNSPTMLSQSLEAAQHMMDHRQQQQIHQQQQPYYQGQQQAQQPNDIGGHSIAPVVTAAEDPFLSNATIVTNNNTAVSALSTSSKGTRKPPPPSSASTGGMTFPPTNVIIKTPKPLSGGGAGSGTSDRRHSMPSSIILRAPISRMINNSSGSVATDGTSNTEASKAVPSHPVPEFLCHLYSMLRDPALNHLISWIVPTTNESAHCGGGKAGIGKIVIHDPTRLQNEVLGNYYRHSKYSSFQRQLNYFGFKKRLHGSRKGKLCPCSFINDTLGTDPVSLLNLKRRPPSTGGKHKSDPKGSSVVSAGTSSKGSSSKKRPHPKSGKTKNLVGSVGVPSLVSVQSNASWPGSQSSKPIASAPLNMPIMAKAAPGTAWVPAPANVMVNGTNDGMMPMIPPSMQYHQSTSSCANPTSPGLHSINNNGINNNEDYMSKRLQDANKANVLEAKKSLERNFLKSQQEQQAKLQQQAQQDNLVEPQIRYVDQPQVTHPLQGRNHAIGLPQQQQQQQQSHQVIVQQQQPMMVPPNRFPSIHPFGSQVTLNNGSLVQPGAMISADNVNNGMEKLAFPVNNLNIGNSSSGFSQSLVNNSIVPQANTSFLPGASTFPITKAQLVGNFGNAASGDSMKISTSYLMAPPPAIATSSGAITQWTNKPHMTNVANSSFPVMDNDASQQDFNDMLSNLLSTALPPSDELFDDDMSAGNISDCFDDDASSSVDMGLGEGHLQVADDGRGMLLPPSPL